MTQHAQKKLPKNESVLKMLYKLQHELRYAHKENNPKLKEIEDLAEKTWKANFYYESRLNQLEKEKRMLEQTMKNVWEGFDKLVLPMWRVDGALVPLYESLVESKRQLEVLDLKKKVEEGVLLKIQESLHNLENVHYIDGKYVPSGWKRNLDPIPSGQSVIASLVARNYKLVRKIQEKEPSVSSNLISLEKRLNSIVNTLDMIKDNYTVPYEDEFGPIPIEPLEVRVLQEQLMHIEALQKDGVFYDEDGTVPEGQAIVRDLLEQGYDLVHDCLIEIENQNVRATDLIAEAITQARFVADSIFTQVATVSTEVSKEARNVSLSTLNSLQATLAEGSSILKEIIENPTDSLKSATRVLAYTTRSALGFLSKLYNVYEPVDQSLVPIYDTLVKTKNSLKDIRNQTDLIKMKNDPRVDKIKLDKSLRALQDILLSIEEKKIDGKYLVNGELPKGQALLSSLEDECYCLVAEVI